MVSGRVVGTEAPVPAGIAGVGVSDGRAVTRTDADGRYRLPIDPRRRHTSLVHITVPSGWRAPRGEPAVPRFYRHVDLSAGDVAGVDFTLHPDPAANDTLHRFVVLADVHVQDGSINPPGTFRRQLAQVNRHAGEPADATAAPRFVVIAGDLTNDATDAELAGFRAATGASVLPVWPAPGNHDLTGRIPGGPQPKAASDVPYRDVVDAYRRWLGPEWYSFQYGGRHYVVLENYRGLTEPDQLAWLRRDLALNAPGREVVVIAHVPWDVPQTPASRHKSAYLRLFSEYDVRLLLAGHIHGNDVGAVGQAIQAVTTSTAYALDQTPRGFRLVEVGPGRIGVPFVELDANRRGSTAAAHGAAQAAVVSPRQGAPWPMFHHDPAHSGTGTDVVRPPLRLAWAQRTGGRVLTSSPAVAGGTVFIGVRSEDDDAGNGVLALDLATGERRWRAGTGSPVESSVAVEGTTVLSAPVKGPLLGLDADTGTERWRWAPGDQRRWMYFSPTVAGGTAYQAYVDSSGVWVVALDALTGEPQWHTSAPIGRNWLSHGSPAVLGNRLVFATAYANLACLDRESGDIRWQRAFGGWTRSMPVVVGDLVLLACQGDRLVAADLDSGRPIWHYEAPGAERAAPTTATPAVAGGVAYAGFADGSVAAVDVGTGAARWRHPTGGPVTSSVAVSGEVLYVACDDGVLRALDRRTGACVWSSDLGCRIASSPAVTGNAVVVGAWDGYVYAFVAAP